MHHTGSDSQTASSEETIAALREQITRLQQSLQESQQQIETLQANTASQELLIQKNAHHAEQYRLVIEHMADPVMVICQGVVQFVNPAAEAIFGLSAKELVGTEIGMPSTGEHKMEMEIVTGESFVAEMHFSAIEWEGNPGYIASVRDITAHKQAHGDLEQRVQDRTTALSLANAALQGEIAERYQIEEALRQSETRYREVTELISDLVYSFRIDDHGNMLQEWGFDDLYTITGYARGEIGLQEWLDIVLDDDKTIVKDRFTWLLAGEVVVSEYRIVTKDGEIRWLRDHSQPIWDDDLKRVVRVYGAIKDVSIYKQAGQSLRESERMLSTLMRNLPGMAYRSQNDSQWTIEYVSEGCIGLTGYTPSELIGKAVIWYGALVHPNDQQANRDSVQAALQEHRPFELTYRIRTADNQEKWVWEQGMGVFWENGDILAIEGFITDVTEQKMGDARIRQYAARTEALARVAERLNAQLELSKVMHNVCEAVVMTLSVPIATISLYDKQQDNFVVASSVGDFGKTDSLFAQLAPQPRAVIEAQLCKAKAIHYIPDIWEVPDIFDRETLIEAHVRTIVMVGLKRKGKLIGLLNAFTLAEVREFTNDELTLLKGIAGQAALAIDNARLFNKVQQERTLLAQRVSERTAELSKANAELSRAVRTKDEFLATMSHELRTPLNAILGLTESLQERIYGPLNDKQLQTLQTVEMSGRHLLDLINDILDIAKIEAGKMELFLDQVPIDTVCYASMQFVRQQALKKNIRISYQQQTDIVTILADVRRLKQILVNLLGNAVKFTPEGGEIGLIVASNDDEQDVIDFTVWDTGIGIPQEDMDRLFEAFVQLDSSLSREHVGSGLGLSLVVRLSEIHGGSVSVESTIDEGSRFTVSLPVLEPTLTKDSGAMSAPVVLPEIEKPSEHHISIPLHRAPGPLGPTVLLAEDNETSIKLFTEYLSVKGYRLVIARNGVEAVERAREERPSLILMDMQMPRMDGMDAMQHIHADANLAHIPIVALTALAMAGDRERCLSAGASEYLSKPVSLKKLLTVVERYVGASGELDSKPLL